MRLPRIHFGRPQRLAALLLLIFLGECLYVINHQTLSTDDYRFALCGRQMWEKPSPLAGYYTTCGNLHGDGTFAYRLAGLPLTLERLLLLGLDTFRRPENRVYTGGSLNGSTWEARHQLSEVKYLLHLPFVLFAMWLGGGLWWVGRRLFGNEGGFFALGLYCFCPAIVAYAVRPNNEVLAMWGLYGLVYTAMGVAHAMQGPKQSWQPRMVLLVFALGLTATAHLLAALVGFVAAIAFLFYLAERRRSHIPPIVIYSALGALLVLLASYGFRLGPFTYVFTGGGARFGFSLGGAGAFAGDLLNAPLLIASAVALLLYVGVTRCRYFGNTAPLLMVAAILPLETTQTLSAPWLWTLPFLFTFVGGVFADALETRYRKLFLCLTGGVLVTQALLCFTALTGLAR